MILRMSNLSSVTVAILAGGFGKRLQSVVGDRPKVLAEVGNTPFLQKLLDQLNSAGFKNVVFCIGYLGSQIKEKFGKSYKNLELLYSEEQLPLGTGGALREALPLLKSESVLVMNGDSFCDIDFNEFSKFHFDKKADATLALVKILKPTRFGSVNLGTDEKILGFEEKKKGSKDSWINAGIYLLKSSLISGIPEGINTSLEKEVFPKWVKDKFFGYKSKDKFLDIGTPSSYAEAEHFFGKSRKQQRRFVLLDRDGTLVVHHPYLSNPDQIKLIPGAINALKEFKKLGLGVVVITNQAGIGRGYFDLKVLEKIHQRLTDLLAKEGIFLDDIYFCPHIPEDNCLCRKPKIGMVKKAMKKHHFDPKLCFVIGDSKADIKLGEKIEAATILVRTGYGAAVEKGKAVGPDWIVNNLFEASNVIKKFFKTKDNLYS